MLIVAVSSKTEGEMLRVRPVREKDSFRTRSPTTQSEPPSRHNIEKETRRVVRSESNLIRRKRRDTETSHGVTFLDKREMSSISDLEYTTASDTELSSKLTVHVTVENSSNMKPFDWNVNDDTDIDTDEELKSDDVGDNIVNIELTDEDDDDGAKIHVPDNVPDNDHYDVEID